MCYAFQLMAFVLGVAIPLCAVLDEGIPFIH
mgnify:CR=1 FL=1